MYGYGPGITDWDRVPFVGWPLVGALLALVAAVLVALLGWYLDRGDRAARAQHLLAERLARGEIDENDHLDRTRVLSDSLENAPDTRRAVGTGPSDRDDEHGQEVPGRTHRPR